jgi:hypothetical protein
MPILGTIASSRVTATPANMTFISTTTVSGSSTSAVSLSGFSGYDDIMVLASARTHSGSNADMAGTINNDTSANYSGKILFASGSANGEASFAAANMYRFGYGCYPDMTANYYGNSMIYLHDYANTTAKKTIRWQAASPVNTSASNLIMGEAICSWNSTSAITSLQITMAPFGVNFADGSQFFVYGITR